MAKRRKQNRKWISWAVFLVLIVVAGVVIYFVWDGYFREKDTLDGGESAGMAQTTGAGTSSGSGSGTKETENKDATDDGEVIEKQEIVNYEGENPNTAENLTGVVTYAGVSGGDLVIRVNIDQYLTGGECRLVLNAGGELKYTETVGVVAEAATSTCEGFNVPIGKLVGATNYEIVIYVDAEGKSGVILGEAAL